jgi:hypothetical protein
LLVEPTRYIILPKDGETNVSQSIQLQEVSDFFSDLLVRDCCHRRPGILAMVEYFSFCHPYNHRNYPAFWLGFDSDSSADSNISGGYLLKAHPALALLEPVDWSLSPCFWGLGHTGFYSGRGCTSIG